MNRINVLIFALIAVAVIGFSALEESLPDTHTMTMFTRDGEIGEVVLEEWFEELWDFERNRLIYNGLKPEYVATLDSGEVTLVWWMITYGDYAERSKSDVPDVDLK